VRPQICDTWQGEDLQGGKAGQHVSQSVPADGAGTDEKLRQHIGTGQGVWAWIGVMLPDVSGSIDRQALKQAFNAIDELISHLRRGDRIAIIPILGDCPNRGLRPNFAISGAH
jgi:hypothetical protein